MTTTDSRPRTHRTGTQTVATITRAEVKRLLGRGGIRGWLVVAAILAIGSGVLAVLMSGAGALRDVGGITAADVSSSGPVTVALVLSLAVTHYVPREVGDGTVMTARCLVPRTKVLFAGRMLAWCLVTACLAVATALVPLPLALVLGDVVASSPVQLAAGLLTSVGLATLLMGLAHAAATLLQRGALVVAVGMTMLVVLPMVITLGSFLMSGAVATGLVWLSRVVLGSLVLTALQVPTGVDQSWGPWAWSMVGLLAWWVATTSLAYQAFRRPGYGDR